MLRKVLFLTSILLLQLTELNVMAQQFIEESTWWIPADGSVNCMDYDSANQLLYLGGDFTGVGRYHRGLAKVDTATGVADWNFLQTKGHIYEMIPDGNGGWYVGGDFEEIDGEPRVNIAHIDENDQLTSRFENIAFQNSASISDGFIYSMVRHGDSLFVVGKFDGVSNTGFRPGIAALDTATSATDTSFPSTNGNVRSIISDGNGGWFIGGDFDTVGQYAREGLAHINSNWQVTDWYVPVTASSSLFLIRDMVIHNQELIIGGNFTSVEGQSRSKIAKISIQDTTVSSWNPGASSMVITLKNDGDTLYMGGFFTSVGGTSRSRLAAVSLTSGNVLAWDPGASSTVEDIELRDTAVLVAGSFTTLGGQPRNYIGAVSKATGNATSWGPNASHSVYEMQEHNGLLYVSGNFTSIGGQFRKSLAALNINTGIATSWSPTLGALTNNNRALKILIEGGKIIIGGGFSDVDTLPRSNLAMFDLNSGELLSWRPYSYSTVEDMVMANDKLLVCGRLFGGAAVNSFMGLRISTEEVLPFQPYFHDEQFLQIEALSISEDTLYVGGNFGRVDGIPRGSAASFDLTNGNLNNWNPGINSGGINQIIASGDTVYVAGSFSTVGDSTRNDLARFLLSQSSVQPDAWKANTNGSVSAIELIGNKLYASGTFGNVNGVLRSRLAAIDVNQNTNNVLPWNPGSNGSVYAMQRVDADLFAGFSSNFTIPTIGGGERNYFAMLDRDSATNNLLPYDPGIYGVPYAMHRKGGHYYIAGSFQKLNVKPANGAAAIDVTTGEAKDWNPDLNGPAYAIKASGGTVYIGGDFTTSSGTTRNNIAAVSASSGLPTAWNPNANGEVYSLALDNGLLYVGGDFSGIGGATRNNIAALDPTQNSNMATPWNPNPNDIVRTIEAKNSIIFFGGEFTQLGSSISRTRLAAAQSGLGTILSWAPTANNTVFDIEASDTSLFIAGEFTMLNSTGRDGLGEVKLNNGLLTNWDPNANEIGYGVSLNPDSSMLAYGGDFSMAGGQNRADLALFNTDSVSNNLLPFDKFQPTAASYKVYSTLFFKDWLAVGGSFVWLENSNQRYLTVYKFNEKPEITAPADYIGCPGEILGPFSFSVVDEQASQLTYSTSSSDQQIIADSTIIIDLNGVNPTIQLTSGPFANGSTIITISATDQYNLVGVDTFIVTIADTTAPALSAPSTINVNIDAGQCTASNVALGTPVVSDNCLLDTVYHNAQSGFAIGSTNVTWTAIDAFGNVTTAIQIVNVNDPIAPTIQAPSNVFVQADSGECWASAVALGQAVASDNCSSVTISNDAPSQFPIGETVVVWSAVDSSGNIATDSQTVVVNEVIVPMISAPNDVQVFVDSGTCFSTSASIGNPIATDNCNLAAILNNAPDTFPSGINLVIWTAIDSSGNIATDTQVVEIIDNEAPMLSAPADISATIDQFSCLATNVSLGTPVAADNCALDSISNNAPSAFPIGTTIVTWTAVDESGNVATANQLVTIADLILPTIVAPVDINIVANAGCFATSVDLGIPTVTDNCLIDTVFNNAPINFPVGTTSVLWTVVDSWGNTATSSQLVTVIENTPPTITAPASITTYTDINSCHVNSVSLGTPTVNDNCSVVSVINDAPQSYPLGTTLITWTAIDESGNTDTSLQSVTVIDTIKPIIIAPGNVSAQIQQGFCANGNINLGSALASDNCGVQSVTNDAPTIFPIGTTLVTWTATDSSGNSNSSIQTVIVSDNEAPTVVAPSDINAIAALDSCSKTISNLGIVSAFDNCSTPSVSNNAPSVFPIGLTTVIWTATDAWGNSSSDTQLVFITETVQPLISAPADITIPTNSGSCSASSVNLGLPVASDNCNLIATSNNAPSVFPLGNTSITWTAIDEIGNTNTDLQSVNVLDQESPTIDAPTDLMLFSTSSACTLSNLSLGNPTVGDNCAIQNTSNNAPTAFSPGTTSIIWTVFDQSNNSASDTQTVTVNDTISPTIIPPGSVSINADSGLCTASNVNLGSPVVNDNCSVISTTNDAPTVFAIGNTVVTWTVTDASGNQKTAIQTVTVNDNESPVPNVTSLQMIVAECNVQINSTPTATDNCAGLIQGTTNDPLTYNTQGNYNVVWTFDDGNGNSTTQIQQVIIQDTTAPTFANCSQDIIACAGTPVIFSSPTGSDNCTPVSVIQISGPLSGSVFPIGTTLIEFELTDTNGNSNYCSFNVEVIDNPTLFPELTPPLCFGDSNGSITISVSNGTPPYFIDWNGIDSNNVGAGTYTISVVDQNDCTTDTIVVLSEPDSLQIQTQTEFDTIGNCTGKASAFVNGGTPPYTYLWSDPSNQTNDTATSLCAGEYCVTVTDSNACTQKACDIMVILSNEERKAIQQSLSVYPNPNFGSFHVRIPDGLKASELSVIDATGRIIESRSINNTGGIYHFSGYTHGTYFIRVSGSDEVFKLIVL